MSCQVTSCTSQVASRHVACVAAWHATQRYVVLCMSLSHHVISRRVISHRILSCRVTSCHVRPCHVTSRRVTSCYVCRMARPGMLGYVVLRHVLSGPITSRCVVSCHATSRRAMSRHGVSRLACRGRVLCGPRALACLTPRRREQGALRMLRLGSYRLH